jgi:CheY-like chemotaxis protein
MIAVDRENDARQGTAEASVLCVDDEPDVLAGLKATLRGYNVKTATDAGAGLELLTELAPVTVVISDMRMPHVSGAQFLKQVAERFPTTVRILLTGASDLYDAVDAVNNGNLFRFLLKPCPADQLRSTLKDAIAYHRTITSERELLGRTLLGSIRALTEVLAIADHNAFGRIGRLKELALATATQLNLADRWSLEYAALVCQLGNISLSDVTTKKLYLGLPTTVAERIQIDQAAYLPPKIIAHIPRLESVHRILESLALDAPTLSSPQDPGSEILRIVLAYEQLERTSKGQPSAISALRALEKRYDPDVFAAFLKTIGETNTEPTSGVAARIDQLRPGMITMTEIRSPAGVLIAPAGIEITSGLIAKLANFSLGSLPEKIIVRPKQGRAGPPEG